MTGLDKRKVQNILVAALKKLGLNDFESGLEDEAKLYRKQRFELGLPLIDSHLGFPPYGGSEFRGLESGLLVEIFGPQWGGKTLLCAQIAVLSQVLQQDDEHKTKVVWFDADGTFRENTIREIAFRFELDPEKVVEQIHVVRMAESRTLNEYFDIVLKLSANERIGLIVIDSLQQATKMCSDSPTLPKVLGKIGQARYVTKALAIVTNRSPMKLSEISNEDASSTRSNLRLAKKNYQFLLEPMKDNELRIALIQVEGLPENEWTIMHGYGGLFQDRKAMNSQQRRVIRYIRRLKKTKAK